jgi:NDP-sugar pyrophosphorylase family protein
MQKILNAKVTPTRISPGAKISKTSIIEGPCVIEEGTVLDDFCKLKGPAYIGKNSFIGMGSLVRNSILEQNTKIGFKCEIGKSYFAGHDKISHHNVILDSIVGQNVWLGGYAGTANVLLDRRNIRNEINGKLVDTGTDHFGSVIGDNCCIGASVIILPGRRLPPNSQIQAGTIIKS